LVGMCIGMYKRQAVYRTRVVIRICGGKKGGRILRKVVINYLV